jgi:hypothetical protein
VKRFFVFNGDLITAFRKLELQDLVQARQEVDQAWNLYEYVMKGYRRALRTQKIVHGDSLSVLGNLPSNSSELGRSRRLSHCVVEHDKPLGVGTQHVDRRNRSLSPGRSCSFEQTRQTGRLETGLPASAAPIRRDVSGSLHRVTQGPREPVARDLHHQHARQPSPTHETSTAGLRPRAQRARPTRSAGSTEGSGRQAALSHDAMSVIDCDTFSEQVDLELSQVEI